MGSSPECWLNVMNSARVDWNWFIKLPFCNKEMLKRQRVHGFRLQPYDPREREESSQYGHFGKDQKDKSRF